MAFLLALALRGTALARTGIISRDSSRDDVPANIAASSPAGSSEARAHLKVNRYVMDFDGDHSVDIATVTEQAFAGYATYTVQLQLASGAEQSVVVAAPPGGLQIEMHDMTGDKVPNDLLLRPALFRWLPTVLVNDGHDHFAVAIAGADPRSFSSNADYGSQRRDCQSFALLTCSGFKTVALAIHDSIFGLQARGGSILGFSASYVLLPHHAPNPGRAPPFAISI